jgi:transposase InsO family protein
VKLLCEILEISRASYYAWRKRKDRPDPDQERMKMILEAYQVSFHSYGYRRIQIWIEGNYGVNINHKAVLRLMNKLGIQSVARKRKPSVQWSTSYNLHFYPNHLKRDFSATKPNQKWTTDITYIKTNQGWAYLCAIKDLYDGFIVAYKLGRRQSHALVTNTLKQAMRKEMVTDELILHSDQGHQYSSQAYYVLTKAYKITPSMSRRGNCWDNAPIENFFGHLKQECLNQFDNLSFLEVKQVIDQYIHFFNYERIQLKTKQAPFKLRCLSI